MDSCSPSFRPTLAVDLRALVLPPAGIGVHTEELLVSLAHQGSFRLVGLAHRPLAEPKRLEREGIEVRIQSAPSGFLWQHLLAPRAAEGCHADLYWSPVFTLPFRLPIPGIVSVHDLAAWEAPETLTWKVRWSLRPFLRSTLRRAKLVITGSQAVALELNQRFPEVVGKLCIIPNGVDHERFRPASSEAIAEQRRKLGFPQGYLLFLGTLEPRKNVDALLDAWENLEPPRPPLLLVGGSGWQSQAIQRRCEELRPLGVRWLGRLNRSEALAVLQAATALVYPSQYEGFGLPVLEGMACGVPVLTSRASALVELGDGATLQIDPRNRKAFASALSALWHQAPLRAELRERGLARAQEFSWARAAQRFGQELQALLQCRVSAP
jgi:glycosyltransferase involved in cell wall biosynthesis